MFGDFQGRVDPGIDFPHHNNDLFRNRRNGFRFNNNYEVSVVLTNNSGWTMFGGSDTEAKSFEEMGHTYYELPHNTEYKIKMHNRSSEHVNAVLTIDGDEMGKWRIGPHSDITVERPIHNQRKFTFVEENSWEGNMGGVRSKRSKNGLVEVCFIPEVGNYSLCNDSLNNGSLGAMAQNYNESVSNSVSKSAGMNLSFGAANSMESNYSAGGTVLGNDSSQRFNDASHIIEDTSRAVIKRIRLVVVKHRSPYVQISTRGPLGDIAGYHDDEVPPRIGSRSRARARRTIYDDDYLISPYNTRNSSRRDRYPGMGANHFV
jgi:hypothetical protein